MVTVTALDAENGYQAWKIQLTVEFRKYFSASVLNLKKNQNSREKRTYLVTKPKTKTLREKSLHLLNEPVTRFRDPVISVLYVASFLNTLW